MTGTNIKRLPFSIPGSAAGMPVIPEDVYGNTIVRMLPGMIDRWIYAGGQQLSDSPLTMRDAAYGQPVATLGQGDLFTSVTSSFNGFPWIDLPGDDLESQFRLDDHRWPDNGFTLILHLLLPATEGWWSLCGRSGGNPLIRVDTTGHRILWRQGATGETYELILTNATKIVTGTPMLLAFSYDATLGESKIFLNSYDHVAYSLVHPNIDPAGYYTYFGGSNSTSENQTSMPTKFSDILLLNEPMHGDSAREALRVELFDTIAARYGRTLV